MSRPVLRTEVAAIALRLVTIQGQLADIGLYATMHAVNKASQKLGWEVAEMLKKQGRKTK